MTKGENEKSPGSNAIECPECGSTQVAAHKKGFSIRKAAAGLLVPGGVLWGFHGSKDIMVTCLNCGKSWKAGKKR